jgi:large subunit ribosomal protein L5
MIPGIDIICCTTATNDRDARLLLSALGVPFQGQHVNY